MENCLFQFLSVEDDDETATSLWVRDGSQQQQQQSHNWKADLIYHRPRCKQEQRRRRRRLYHKTDIASFIDPPPIYK